MTIDLSKLSSEELFELARQRQKAEEEEKQRTAAKERVAELQKKRNALAASHEEALKKADAAIAELQAKRSKLIAEHEAALSALEKEALEIERLLATPAPKTAPAAAPAQPPARPVAEEKKAPAEPVAAAPAAKPASAEPASVEPAAASAPPPSKGTKITTTDELIVYIREMILGRSYISESLIRDKLMSKGIGVSGLHKLIDQLVREQRLSSKGGGNYALGRKA